jgi:hypothetical protein
VRLPNLSAAVELNAGAAKGNGRVSGVSTAAEQEAVDVVCNRGPDSCYFDCMSDCQGDYCHGNCQCCCFGFPGFGCHYR